jgi:hypothetical protein
LQVLRILSPGAHANRDPAHHAGETREVDMSETIERLRTEADLCRNEGAEDIAKLLDQAAAELKELEQALANEVGQETILLSTIGDLRAEIDALQWWKKHTPRMEYIERLREAVKKMGKALEPLARWLNISGGLVIYDEEPTTEDVLTAKELLSTYADLIGDGK